MYWTIDKNSFVAYVLILWLNADLTCKFGISSKFKCNFRLCSSDLQSVELGQLIFALLTLKSWSHSTYLPSAANVPRNCFGWRGSSGETACPCEGLSKLYTHKRRFPWTVPTFLILSVNQLHKDSSFEESPVTCPLQIIGLRNDSRITNDWVKNTDCKFSSYFSWYVREKIVIESLFKYKNALP